MVNFLFLIILLPLTLAFVPPYTRCNLHAVNSQFENSLNLAADDNRPSSGLAKFWDQLNWFPPLPKNFVAAVALISGTVALFEISKLAFLFGVPIYFAMEYFKHKRIADQHIDTVIIEESKGQSDEEIKAQIDEYTEKFRERRERVDAIKVPAADVTIKHYSAKLFDRQKRIQELNSKMASISGDLQQMDTERADIALTLNSK